MRITVTRSLSRITFAVSILAVIGWSTNAAAQVTSPPDSPKAAQDASKDVFPKPSNGAKGASATDPAKKAADREKDSAADAKSQDTETAKDARDSAKDTTKDARDAAKDTTKDARDAAKDTADSARDSARGESDEADEAREPPAAPGQDRPAAGDRSRDRRTADQDSERLPTDRARRTGEARQDLDARQRDRTTDQDRERRSADRTRPRTGDAREDATERESARISGREEQRGDDRRSRRGDQADSERDEESENLGLTFSAEAESDEGLMVDELERNSVAARAGIRGGDVILSLNGRRISSQRDFSRWVTSFSRSPLRVIVLRGGRQQTIVIQPSYIGRAYPPAPQQATAYLGISMDAQYSDAAVINYVNPNSPAARADLRRGDVIVSIDGEQIESPRHLTQIIRGMEPGDEVQVEISYGDDQVETLNVVLGALPAPRMSMNQRFNQPRDVYYQERYDDDREFRDEDFDQANRRDGNTEGFQQRGFRGRIRYDNR